MLTLIHKSSGKLVTIGDKVTDFRGEKAVITDVEMPRHSGSTGRVYVRNEHPHGFVQGFYPSVFGLEWKSTNEESLP